MDSRSARLWADCTFWVCFWLIVGGCNVGYRYVDRRVEVEAIRAGLVQDSSGHWVKPVEVK